jgi:hypothetical protein
MSRRIQPAILAALALTLTAGSPSLAKGPTLTGLFPAGAARGQTLTVAATGSFDHWPVTAWTDGAGLSIAAGSAKGTLEIRVAADAEPGIRWVRLWDQEGATALRPFLIGTLPEVVESEPNDDPRRPQVLPRPSVTVNGRLAKTGDVDGFSVPLRRGETLVADLEANRHLGSPMDAVLQVVSASGFVLAQNDDTVGRDPRIVFEVPADGTYTVRLFAFPTAPNSSIQFAGGESFVYRLTLTTGGFLDHVFPLAVSRDTPTKVAAVGPNIPEAARVLAVTGDPGRDEQCVWHPMLAGTAEVRVVPGPAAVESEPNDPAHPQEIRAPAAISGRLDPPGDQDNFRFTLKKGEKRVVQVESRSLGLPLDAILRLTDAKGKQLDESDDVGEGRDPKLAFTAPADGEYRIQIRDLNDQGGPRFSYLILIRAPEPDFSLSIATDRFEVIPGKSTNLSVTIDRKDGFTGAIEIRAEGLPDGVTTGPVTSKPGDDSSKTVTLSLSADGRAHPGSFRVVGKAASLPTSRAALAAIADFAAKTDRPWLTIRPSPGSAKP